MDTDEWYTPPKILHLVKALFGGRIDLDAASCETAQRVVQARDYFDKAKNGLEQQWYGSVFLNPPYSFPLVQEFARKAISEYEQGNCEQIWIVVNNRTDAKWFTELAHYPMMLSRGRIAYWQTIEQDGNPIQLTQTRQGQAFFYLGPETGEFFRLFGEIAYAPNRFGEL